MQQDMRIRRLDNFRWIAAALVVAIHTSPLESLNETADFLLTRVVARVAVPFFFMVTGYFVLAEEKGRKEKMKSTLGKMGTVYFLLTLLYLPVQCYKVLSAVQTGKVSITGWEERALFVGKLTAEAVRAVFFDGTYYHLWYFPALLLGLCLAGVLLRQGIRRALFGAGVLYLFGMLGDSYYGITENLPLLKRIFGELFAISSYTRNGIFYAPLFLILGAGMAGELGRRGRRESLLLTAGSMLLMMGEGLLLHHFHLQRHDSMYVLLPFVMVGLFGFLLEGERTEAAGSSAFFRKIPMLVYYLHPMVILGLRGVVKITHLPFLLTVSPLYFLLVLCGSVAAACICLFLAEGNRGQKRRKKGQEEKLCMRG